jgi:hypothetical protein
MYRTRLGAMDLSTALTFLLGAAVCYAAWLTSIVFCAANGAPATADRCGDILSGRHRPWYRHLVRRMVIWINAMIDTKAPCGLPTNRDAVGYFHHYE